MQCLHTRAKMKDKRNNFELAKQIWRDLINTNLSFRQIAKKNSTNVNLVSFIANYTTWDMFFKRTKDDISYLSSRIVFLQNELKKANTQLNKYKNQNKNQNYILEQKVKILEDKLKNKENELERLKNELNVTKNENILLNDKNIQNLQKIDELTQKIDNLEYNLNELQRALIQEQSKLNSYKLKINKIRKFSFLDRLIFLFYKSYVDEF